MKEIDPGHFYHLHTLDGGVGELLRFVKRVGPGYPGNTGSPHAGTTLQEVIRVLIKRTIYVQNQAHEMNDTDSVADNSYVIQRLRDALWALEERAARRHGRVLPGRVINVEDMRYCLACGHVGCENRCGR